MGKKAGSEDPIVDPQQKKIIYKQDSSLETRQVLSFFCPLEGRGGDGLKEERTWKQGCLFQKKEQECFIKIFKPREVNGKNEVHPRFF